MALWGPPSPTPMYDATDHPPRIEKLFAGCDSHRLKWMIPFTSTEKHCHITFKWLAKPRLLPVILVGKGLAQLQVPKLQTSILLSYELPFNTGPESKTRQRQDSRDTLQRSLCCSACSLLRQGELGFALGLRSLCNHHIISRHYHRAAAVVVAAAFSWIFPKS